MMPSSTSTQPNQPRRKTALVLAGGGITGFLYEVGVLTALDELAGRALSNDLDVYVGTSAGAVLAALLANGAHAAEIFAAMTQNEAGSPFYFESRDILGVGPGGPLRMMGQFARATFGTLGRALRAKQRPSFAQMFADFQEHHPPGFYSTEALEKTLCDRFSVLGYSHQFDKLSRELFVTGTDIDTGEHLVFGAGEFADSHICRAVAASCAIPVFFRPIRIGDRDVVDGGVSEVCPLEIAVERAATAIVFVNPMVPIRNDRARICIPTPGGHCARLSEKGVGWIGDQAMRLMRAHSLGSAIDALRSNPRVELLHVEPGRDEMKLFMHSIMSFSTGRELLEYGRDSGRRFFASSGAAILSTGDSCASVPDHSLTAGGAGAAVSGEAPIRKYTAGPLRSA
jgi:predicted acylesterase/phospholipase RssA